MLSGIVVNGLALGQGGPGLAYWPCRYFTGYSLGEVVYHIASPVFPAPRNCGRKVSIRTGPI